MWRLRSSILSSASASSNNNDPPATNRRDPDQEVAATPAVVVMDRPLLYSNVDSVNEHDHEEEEEEQGLMVVPPATDEDDDKVLLQSDDDDDDLSVNPNQLTDSSLLNAAAAVAVIMEDAPVGNATLLVQETPQQEQVDDDEEEEGVLVDEITQEEQDFLDSLKDIQAVAKTNETVVPTRNELDMKPAVHEDDDDDEMTVQDDKQSLVDPAIIQEESDLERMVEEAELLAVQMKEAIELSTPADQQQQHELERMVQEAVDLTAQVKAENMSTKRPRKQEDGFAKLVWPVWRYFTIALGVAAFALMACTATQNQSACRDNNIEPASSLDALRDVVSVDVLPRPMPTPNSLPLAPIAFPFFGRSGNSTTLHNATNVPDEHEEEESTTQETTDEVDGAWLTWQSEIMYAGSLIIFYVACFWIQKGSGTELKNEKSFDVQNNDSYLNSFEGMMAFHKTFRKSGKGRRVALRSATSKPGKFDSSSYDKLTRTELLKILDSFERYVGRDAAKFLLIHDLCNLYEDTLYRFSNAQILQLLQSKGYSVNTNMSKQELVSLAVKVGF